MAQVMNPSQPNMFEAAARVAPQSRPHTPPYTPRRTKIHIERASSPASSIHPTETTSPAKQQSQQQQQTSNTQSQSTVTVQELDESEAARLRDIQLVYPSGVEEHSDSGEARHATGKGAAEADAAGDSDVNESEGGIAVKLARMHCDDSDGEEERRKMRRERRSSKRMSQRFYKRSHSKSINSDSEVTDLDALDDHDLNRSARRLRRKVEDDHAEDMFDTPLRGQQSEASAGDESPVSRRLQSKRVRQTPNSTVRLRDDLTSGSRSWQTRLDPEDAMQLSD